MEAVSYRPFALIVLVCDERFVDGLHCYLGAEHTSSSNKSVQFFDHTISALAADDCSANFTLEITNPFCLGHADSLEHQFAKTVCVEAMLAWKHEELSHQQRQATLPAALSWLHNRIASSSAVIEVLIDDAVVADASI